MARDDELIEDDDKVRFLVTITREDMESLDKARRLASMSRNRFIIAAIWKAIQDTAKCPLCGRTDEHVH